jgi:hypothetical protein
VFKLVKLIKILFNKTCFLLLLIPINFLVYTQAEQVAIVNERSEAAAQKITEIKNNTQAAIAKLVIFSNFACHYVGHY